MLAVLLALVFVAIAWPLLATLPWEYDEGTFMLGARFVARGQRPFVDFAVHQPPLHLHLLALAGDVFGQTVFGYRMLSVASVALSGPLLFLLIRPFAGPVAALVAEAVFLFSPSQLHALSAVAEPPMLFFTVLATVLLFLRTGPWTACASACAFVLALLVKPTCLVMVVAAAASIAWARQWRRLGWFAAAGVVTGGIGLWWMLVSSDGIFADIVRYTSQRVGARSGGLWSIDSGFPELLRLLGIETRAQWTWFCFKNYWYFPEHALPLLLFGISLLGVPVWVRRWARARPDVAAFAVLWPASYLITNFLGLDYVSAKYFVPFLPFSAFLLAGLVAAAVERLPAAPTTAPIAGAVACAALALWFARALSLQPDPWYYGRSDWIAREHPRLISFTPMLFAATGTEAGCDFYNPADTYGDFGEKVLGGAARTRRYRVSDEQLIACLRADPDARIVVDFWFYFFTRPGSALRAYLDGEGAERRVFFSPQALEQWPRPVLMTGAVAR